MNPNKKCIHGVFDCVVCEHKILMDGIKHTGRMLDTAIRDLIKAIHVRPRIEEMVVRELREVSLLLNVMERTCDSDQLQINYEKLLEQARRGVPRSATARERSTDDSTGAGQTETAGRDNSDTRRVS